ncbi:hypothetical protein HDU87_001375 [Geranomyces variabilis]|uniref:Uncharacterized protein n=1 Tax=Geranomyces variabilis TaxID=109894 RepID=A0AAD5TNI4_9FUNG|nr:hypothetical protein HDU87_001375 [Geranomyces variabilis]
MDSNTALVLNLLDRLVALITTWNEHHDNTCVYFDSAVNVQAQRDDTRAYLPDSSKPAVEGWMNPVTTPSIVLEFPDLIPRLLGKQTRSLERSLHLLGLETRWCEQVAASLAALREEALHHLAAGSNQPLDIDPSSISVEEAASWIDELSLQYHRELAAKHEMLASLDLRSETSNLHEVRDRWGLQTWIDLAREQEIRDRLKLLKAAETFL